MVKSISPANGITGIIKIPGDKSISHRAILLCSLADGVSTITGLQTGDDCMATVNIMRELGIEINISGDKATVHGKGFFGLKKPDKPLDAKNSGTTMRLLSGILAWQPFESVLIGDSSLSKRPMNRIIEPLRLMGASIQGENGFPPLKIMGKPLNGIEYKMPVPSAQVKSAILLAGLAANGRTVIHEALKSRTHTEIMLKQLGADIQVNGKTIILNPCSRLNAAELSIPGDFSSAAYFIVAALITPNSQITIRNVGINKERTGFLDVLLSMGAEIEVDGYASNGEPVADITARSSRLTATTVDKGIITRMIDEVPAFAVAASFADGTSVVKDAGELKIKESNRIHTMAAELSKIGADITETDDGFIIKGSNGARLRGGNVNSHGDHRVAMSLAAAGLMTEGGVEIDGAECVSVSYPGFWGEFGSCKLAASNP